VKQYHRHSADVTADRLEAHYEKWVDILSGHEANSFEYTINALREIAGGER
jgi:hypothetical protein